MKIVIDDNAEVTMLTTEGIDLTELGHVRVARASTVEFSEREQQWIVYLPDGMPIFADKSRAKCLAFEREYLEERMG